MIGRLTRLLPAIILGLVLFSTSAVQYAYGDAKPLNLNLEDPQVLPMPSLFGLVLRLLVSLVIIVGLAYVVMRFMRKNLRVMTKGTNIYVLDQYAFSLNKGIYITQVAGRVYVLGVTDHNISLINEITDQTMIDELVAQAKEREMEPIIPPSILERVIPGLLHKPVAGNKSFNEHIQKQIQKLQSVVEKRGDSSRKEDGRNE